VRISALGGMGLADGLLVLGAVETGLRRLATQGD
jgi:hypothetical protein